MAATIIRPTSRTSRSIDGFRGWGRAVTDFSDRRSGGSRRSSPGAVPGRHGQPAMAPHVSLWIVARGINVGLHTRLYFADEACRQRRGPGAAD